MKVVLLFLLFIAYVTFTIYAISKINKAKSVSDSYKLRHSILTCLIPFVWYYLIKDFLDKNNKVVTKSVREQRKKKQDIANFYEGGHG